MSEQHDREFIKRFSLTLVGLVVFTFAIIILAVSIHGTLELSDNPARETARQQRVQPVANVFAGETGRAAAQAAAAAAVADSPQIAFEGSLDGGLIYDRVCGTCHEVGAAGAPVMVASAWGDRLNKSNDQLVASVINGLGAMPPRAGRRDLSDEQVESSVEYMLGMLE